MRVTHTPLFPLTQQETAKFWQNIDCKLDSCWPWLGIVNKNGRYGLLCLRGKILRATRLMVFLSTGSDPQSLLVRHSCDNPNCVNPEHLLIGTVQDNSNDAQDRKRYAPLSGESWFRTHREAIGSKHYYAKLTESDILKIRELYDAGKISVKILAKKYNVTPANICIIGKRQSWKHLK